MTINIDQWTIRELLEENEMLHAENSMKLTQILDLEQLLYETRIMEKEDGSPCWCCLPSVSDNLEGHDETCIKARQATVPFWKK